MPDQPGRTPSPEERAPQWVVESHPHPTEPGVVLGTLCTVCATSLDDGGCPLCVTCCEREP